MAGPSNISFTNTPSRDTAEESQSPNMSSSTWLDALFGCCLPWSTPSSSALQAVDNRPATPYPHPFSQYTPGDAYLNTQRNSLAKLPPKRTYGNLTDDALPPRRNHSNGSSTTKPRGKLNTEKPLPGLPPPRAHAPSTRRRRPSQDLGDLVNDDLPKNYPLVPSIMVEVVDKLDQLFGHIHYGICGLSAMALWGYTRSVPVHISILVPDYSKDVVKSWSKTKALETHPDKPDFLWLRTRDGIARKIRIKWLSEETFSRLSIVTVPLSLTPDGEIDLSDFTAAPSPTFGGLANAKVVSLPSMLNQIAEAYVKDKRAQNNPKYMATIAQHVFWVLHKIIDDGLVRQSALMLTPQNVPGVMNPRFWDVFSKKYPEAPGLFARAGLDDSKSPNSGDLGDRFDGYGTNRSPVDNKTGMYMHDHASRSLTSVYTGVAPNTRNSVATSVATYGSPVDRKPTEASSFQADEGKYRESRASRAPPSVAAFVQRHSETGSPVTETNEEKADRSSQVSTSNMTVASVDGVMITSGMFGNLFRDDD